jgi:hypothetical protein
MFVEFFTSNGIRVQVLEISVLIHKSALVQAYLFLPTGLTLFRADMTEEEYALWGADDNYIKRFICLKMGPILGTPVEGEGSAAIPTMSTQQDDTRSVHNEADIQRINSLQDQLTAMETKLKTITDLLFKNGSL